jgi:hypothetical protein
VPGQDEVRVGCPSRGRAGRHRRYLPGIGENRDQGGPDPGRVEVGVVDEQCPARRDDRIGVVPLLTAAQRQRDVRGRQADSGQFGARQRPRAADREVGRGVGVLHLVDIGDDDVGRVGGVTVRHLDRVLRPGDVQHLHAGAPERRGRAGHRGVDRPGALRTAGDQKYRPVGP